MTSALKKFVATLGATAAIAAPGAVAVVATAGSAEAAPPPQCRYTLQVSGIKVWSAPRIGSNQLGTRWAPYSTTYACVGIDGGHYDGCGGGSKWIPVVASNGRHGYSAVGNCWTTREV